MNRIWTVLHENEHQYAIERLSAYIDRQLPTRERERVQAHLDGCASCRQEVETLRWTKHLLRQAPVMPAPRSFVVRQADVAPQKKLSIRKTWFAPQWATAVVALLFVIVLLGDVLTGSRMASGTREAAMMKAVVAETMVVEADEHEQYLAQEAPNGGTPEKEMIVEPQMAETGEEKSVQEDAGLTPSPAGEQMRAAVPQTPTGGAGAAAVPAPSPVDMQAEKAMPEPLSATQPAETATPLPDTATAVEPEATPTAEAQLMAVQPPTQPPQATTEFAYGASMEPGTARTGWRIAEFVLGAILIGLIVTMILLRRRA